MSNLNSSSINMDYFNNISEVMNSALNEFSRVSMFRIDIRFPDEFYNSTLNLNITNEYITKFIESLRVRLNTYVKNKSYCYINNLKLHYCWISEIGDINNKKHYHVLLFLPKDYFHNFGNFEVFGNNLHTHIRNAWDSALGVCYDGLISFRECIYINKNIPDDTDINRINHHISYLSKHHTKHYSKEHRSFGRSQA